MEHGAVEEQLKQVEEAMEEIRHHEEEERGWLSYVSLSTAIIAIITALAGLYESQVTANTILSKNEAVLLQSEASDQWSFYQAKSVKGHIYKVSSELFPEKADDLKVKVAKYEKEQESIKAEAKKLEEKREAKNLESEHSYHKHHILSFAITFLQISIAMASISALTRNKKFWLASLGLGVTGLAVMIGAIVA
ncbi:MAG: DUF4337 domain-containing protein [Sulfurimonas sp.]|uniref:DUF4337 domain-containing protein n=1 Tax=Sulfurimonas sp. TaxID=2022749 RepID=UPI00261AD23E|nr:DUF4337 domain-containing protein [Sulfurimonas sp.]MDD5400677.1 DUF4337 domain-containing protein [Sulfurimonas sp.]